MRPLAEIRRVTGFPIEIQRSEVLGLLGYSDRSIPGRVRRILDEIETETVPLLRTACSIRRVEAALLARSEFLRGLDAAVFCLVTIGDGVEKAMDAHAQKGDIVRALMLNVYGSAAAEAAADAANALIREEIEREGLRCSRRFSPGYNGWDVAEQRWLLPTLDGEALGVTLTDGCMMVPRKSITFAVSVGEQPVEMREDNACDGCELINCQYRRKTVIEERNGRTWTTFIGPESNYCPLNKWD